MSEEKELLGSFLGITGYNSFEKDDRSSVLLVALRGARKLTGRDLNTGTLLVAGHPVDPSIEVMEEGRYYSNLLLGLTNYLIILDMLGFIFSRKDVKKDIAEEMIHSMKNFTGLLELRHIEAIKALRHSLAHNFGLANKNYIFQLDLTITNLIELPVDNTGWRVKNIKKEENYTKINPIKLCNFVETAYKNLIQQFEHDNLKLKSNLTLDQFMARFTIK